MKTLLIALTLLISANTYAGKLTGISDSSYLPTIKVMGVTEKACANKMIELLEQITDAGRKAIPQKICQENFLKKKDKWATGVILILN